MKIHFIGIGGIGVSALARYYLARGHKVSGSDLTSSEIIKSLKKLGAKISTGSHKAKYLTSDVEQVIYSVAVQKDNPELKRAQKLNIKIQSYPQALGELTKNYFTIAISGAHGKGTTTAMISLILIKAGFDPTVIIGTNLKEFGNTNLRIGKSKYLIVEADEYKKAFLNYWPQIIILTNIDKEHLDCFENLDDIIQTFKKFIFHLSSDGILVVNKDNQNVKKLLHQVFGTAVPKTIQYSLQQKETEKLSKILKIPGEHNVSNALAALSAARSLQIPDKISFEALSQYQGAWRRFEIIDTNLPRRKTSGFLRGRHKSEHESKRITIISDYAHHPTEIKATLQAARQKFPKRKIWVVFQPHQYQRTYYLFDRFVNAFDRADEIVFTQIYSVAGREKKDIIKKVSGKSLTQQIRKRGKKVHFIKNLQTIPGFLKGHAEAGDIILIMGAGDIYRLVEKLV